MVGSAAFVSVFAVLEGPVLYLVDFCFLRLLSSLRLLDSLEYLNKGGGRNKRGFGGPGAPDLAGPGRPDSLDCTPDAIYKGFTVCLGS